MGYISLVNDPLKDAISTVIATLYLPQLGRSNNLPTRAFSWNIELRCITSIVINNVVKSMLSIWKFIRTSNTRFADNRVVYTLCNIKSTSKTPYS